MAGQHGKMILHVKAESSDDARRFVMEREFRDIVVLREVPQHWLTNGLDKTKWSDLKTFVVQTAFDAPKANEWLCENSKREPNGEFSAGTCLHWGIPE